MENFIFSINATLPLFLVILLGWILKYKKILTDEYVNVANKFNFTITLPILLFINTKQSNFEQIMDYKFILLVIGITLACFFVVMGLTVIFVKDKKNRGSFAQGAFRGNGALVGLALIVNMYGTAGMATMALVCVVPLYNICSIIILTIFSDKNEKQDIKKMLLDIARNPLIIGVLSGLVFGLLQIQFPEAIDKTLSSLSDMAIASTLICIGASFEVKGVINKIVPTLGATFIKLIVLPLLFVPIGILLGFRGDALMSIYIVTGLSTAVNSYIMAQNMGNDAILASSIIIVSTLLSTITMTAWIFILKQMALI